MNSTTKRPTFGDSGHLGNGLKTTPEDMSRAGEPDRPT